MKSQSNSEGILLPDAKTVKRKKSPARLKLVLILPPQAAAVFLAACALEDKSPEQAALEAIQIDTAAVFTAGSIREQIDDAFGVDDADDQTGSEVTP